jgi:hypothetical protein
MTKLIQKARIFQSNLLYRHSFKKMLKQRGYRIYLQRHTADLPNLRKLQAWRKWLLYTSILSLMPCSLMTVISWPWAYYDLVFLSPELYGFTSPVIISGSVFLILFSFSFCFDMVIKKRFPTKAILSQ